MGIVKGVSVILLKGKEVAENVYAQIRKTLAGNPGLHPTLATVLVGDDPSSITYVAMKQKKCEELGFGHEDCHLPASATMDEVLAEVDRLNRNPSVSGILVQSPLPSGLDEARVMEAINPAKDVDGFHPVNIGRLLTGKPGFVSCTPLGALELLRYYRIPVAGKHVVVIGRSAIIGKPLAALLSRKGIDATVTLCHSKTQDLTAIARTADIVMVAVGKPGFLTAGMVKEGAVVVDFGFSRVPDSTRKKGYRVAGDVDFTRVAPHCSAITPVPGGVGVMTIAMLMRNTLKAAMQ